MLRAVVVDDEADLRLLARFMLEIDGAAEVIGEAADAGEGLRLIDALGPDVAIVDLHLAGASGVDLIAAVRGAAITTRLIAYSSDDLALRDALRAGADEAVLKTGDSRALVAALVA
jgi:DNA-binding NarL/FixJ family response regulator